MTPESLAALLVPCVECEGEGTIAKGNDGRNTYPSFEPVVTCPACHGARYPALLRHLSEQEERLAVAEVRDTDQQDAIARLRYERDESAKEAQTFQKMYDACFKERDDARARWVLDPIHERIKELERERDGLADALDKEYPDLDADEIAWTPEVKAEMEADFAQWKHDREAPQREIAELRDRLARAESVTRLLLGALPDTAWMLRLRHEISSAAVKDANPALSGYYELIGNWAAAIDAAIAKSQPQERSNAEV